MILFRKKFNVFTVLLSVIFLISSFSVSAKPVLKLTGIDNGLQATSIHFPNDHDYSESINLQPGEEVVVYGHKSCTVSPADPLLPPFKKEAETEISVKFEGLPLFEPEYFALATILPASRKDIYDQISEKIGKTKLTKYSKDSNGNQIWLKQECDNPFGSHYDRVYLDLFRSYEEKGIIEPGDKVLETTSGSAGISFAGIGSILGYDCLAAIPEGGEKARENALKEVGAELIFTEADKYVSGFPEFLRNFLPQNKDYVFLNHSMGQNQTNNEITLSALERITKEVKSEINIDFFVPASGNGSSILGPGRILDSHTNIIVFESFQSAVTFDMKYPGAYKNAYGIDPGTLSRHQLPGTSYPGIDFPHLINAVEKNVIDDVMLISDKYMDAEYSSITGKSLSKDLPHWDQGFAEDFPFGRTTKGGIAVSQEISKKVENQNFLVIAYDRADRYD